MVRIVILCMFIFHSVALFSQVTRTNATVVSGSGTDPQSVSTVIAMPSGIILAAADLTITLKASHTYVGDVTATLTGPCGSTTLFNRPNSGAGNNGADLVSSNDYIFTSTSGTSFPQGSPSVSSNTYNASFSGMTFPCADTGGNWTLTLSTISGGHNRVLTLNSWSISVASITFYDSDGDGILDDTDIDDDNDGIKDEIEELNCRTSSVSGSVNYKFLNETFGTGARTTINTTYDASTSYCYENGVVSSNTGTCTSLSNTDLNDGEYTVYSSAQIASWANSYWYRGGDHTGDVNGRMAIFNASYDPGLFYSAVIKGSLPNVPITYSFWVLNIDRTDAPGIATRLRPNIRVEFRDKNNVLLTTINTGAIAPTTAGNLAGDWNQFTANLTFNVNEFYVYFYNNETGGLGNDLALDDIVISQTLCDSDSDGVADVFDLDSDNDGIPDVVECGLGNLSNGTAKIPSGIFLDTNGNGMHDAAESIIPLDSDGDGVYNYVDLDSDNDGIFDVDESGAGNTADSNFQNGDGDINGDGVGDGLDSDAFRQTDVNSDGIVEYFTDGILNIYDFFEGGTFVASYGNQNQGSTGSGWFHYLKDSDNDGIPDYIDTMSNATTYDILGTLYASLDGDLNGIVDGTTDTDGDGLLDTFDTNNLVFGSPRDLNRKLHLYFDGRNDYAQDINLINSWGEVSLMCWVKIDPLASGSQIIIGQDRFYIQLNADKSITVNANGTTVTNSVALNVNQWIHLAATYSSSASSLKLYINGQFIGSAAVSGNLPTDSSLFTIGKNANANSNYYKGFIDEVRVFNKALSENELHKMVYQEIEDNVGIVRGSIIPLNITDFVNEASITPLSWTSLVRYFRMDVYKDDIIDDLTTTTIDTASGAKIYNTKIIETQSAPLPFITQQSGSLPTAVAIPTDGVNGNDAISYDWSIVKIAHNNVSYNSYQKHLGLFVNELDAGLNPIEFSVQNNSELNVSWYLSLNGFIDLEDESQLVQGPESSLSVGTSGYIERDQQGEGNLYRYNDWSSPVYSAIDVTGNHIKIKDVLKNGTNPSSPGAIVFSNTGYDGKIAPLTLSTYWMYIFRNDLTNNYSKWYQVRSTGNIYSGEGFLMKGTGTPGSPDQNYVFQGKPNNGTINLTVAGTNDYLVGNPYPSAIDADQFLDDNINSITGAIYYWEHYGGDSHILKQYQAGYATYTKAGPIIAASAHPATNTGSVNVTPKMPKRYIPVAQGFFVQGDADGGTISFKNSQRTFITEASGNSIFMKGVNNKSKSTNTNLDIRPKIRLGFESKKIDHRQILLTFDDRATDNVDWGFEAEIYEEFEDDMYWVLNNKKYVIQATNLAPNAFKEFELGVKLKEKGVITIKIDELENEDNDVDIFLKDSVLGVSYNLKQQQFEKELDAGNYANRFFITFKPTASVVLGVDELNETSDLIYVNVNETAHSFSIKSNNSSTTVHNAWLFNCLGQQIMVWNFSNASQLNNLPVNNPSGIYFLKIKTNKGIVNKKIVF